MDPIELSDEILEGFFEEREREVKSKWRGWGKGFITYYGPTGFKGPS